MSTGSKYASFTNKRLLGLAEIKDRFLDYLRELVREQLSKAYGTDGAFDTPIAITADGNDKFQLTADIETTDGTGSILVTAAGLTDGIQFENTGAVVYYIGLKRADKPSGIGINPRAGLPEIDAFEETIGERDDPDAVTDNGPNITFQVDSVTETGRDNTGRKCLVWMKNPVKGAITEAIAIEEATVFFSASKNQITTTGLLGQTAVSTDPTDYEVLLLGPSVRRDTDLRTVAGYVYIGTVTGAGAGNPPTVFSTVGQNPLESSALALLSQITRVDTHGYLKVEVKADSSDSGEDQIRVKDYGGTPRFQVDEAGNTTVDGDLVVVGRILKLSELAVSNWAENASAPTKNVGLQAVAHDGAELWIAVGNGDAVDSYVLSSRDGSAWAEIAPTVAKNVTLYAVAHDQSGLWVAVGAVVDGTDPYILTSPDGAAWSARAPAVAQAVVLRGVAHDGTALWIAVGAVVGGTDPYILESSDGGVADPWAAVAPTVAKAVVLNAVAHNGTDLWCAVGEVVDGTDPYILTSPDGLVWTQRTPAVAKAIALNGVAYDPINGLWCAVGDDIDGSAYILTSNDAGVTDPWVRRTPTIARTVDLFAVAHDQLGLWIAVGAGFAPGRHYILSSPDGIIWTERHTEIEKFLSLLGLAKNADGPWVAVGASDGTNNGIQRSLISPL